MAESHDPHLSEITPQHNNESKGFDPMAIVLERKTTDEVLAPLTPPPAPAPATAPNTVMTDQQVDLLQRSLDHITEHPEQHDQTTWARRTPTGDIVGCFAYHAAVLAGHTVTVGSMSCGCCWTVKDSNGRYVSEIARDALGLTYDQADQLYRDDNSLNRLWELAGEFSEGRVVREPHL